jgi:hypothetical protein
MVSSPHNDWMHINDYQIAKWETEQWSPIATYQFTIGQRKEKKVRLLTLCIVPRNEASSSSSSGK